MDTTIVTINDIVFKMIQESNGVRRMNKELAKGCMKAVKHKYSLACNESDEEVIEKYITTYKFLLDRERIGFDM